MRASWQSCWRGEGGRTCRSRVRGWTRHPPVAAEPRRRAQAVPGARQRHLPDDGDDRPAQAGAAPRPDLRLDVGGVRGRGHEVSGRRPGRQPDRRARRKGARDCAGTLPRDRPAPVRGRSPVHVPVRSPDRGRRGVRAGHRRDVRPGGEDTRGRRAAGRGPHSSRPHPRLHAGSSQGRRLGLRGAPADREAGSRAGRRADRRGIGVLEHDVLRPGQRARARRLPPATSGRDRGRRGVHRFGLQPGVRRAGRTRVSSSSRSSRTA